MPTLVQMSRLEAPVRLERNLRYSRRGFTKVIETNLILHGTPHAFGQPSPYRSTVVHPDCVEIVLKQNNFATMALPLHEFFTSFYREEFTKNHHIQRQAGNVQMFNNGSNLSATITC